MSWGRMDPCWNCGLKYDCRDAENIQAGIDKAHQDTDGHKGGGNVVLMCTNRVPLGKEELA